MPMTKATEKTMMEARPYLEIAWCTTPNPAIDAKKHTVEKKSAKSIGKRPRSQNSTTDSDDEKKTINAVVAAVT